MTPTPPASADPSLDRLAAQCIALRTLIDESGTPVMRRLIDLLLFEIGLAIATPADARTPILKRAE